MDKLYKPREICKLATRKLRLIKSVWQSQVLCRIAYSITLIRSFEANKYFTITSTIMKMSCKTIHTYKNSCYFHSHLRRNNIVIDSTLLTYLSSDDNRETTSTTLMWKLFNFHYLNLQHCFSLYIYGIILNKVHYH